jgi:hypothetical protein
MEWMNKESNLSLNIKILIKRFNFVSSFIKSSIINSVDLKERAKIIEFFIDIGIHCYQINNFNTIFEIVGALTNSAITRFLYY